MKIVFPILSSTVIFWKVKGQVFGEQVIGQPLPDLRHARFRERHHEVDALHASVVSVPELHCHLGELLVGSRGLEELRHRRSPFLGDDNRLVLPLAGCLAGGEITGRNQAIVEGRGEHLVQVRVQCQAISFERPLLLPDHLDIERDVGRRRRGIDRPLSGEKAEPPVLPCGETSTATSCG